MKVPNYDTYMRKYLRLLDTNRSKSHISLPILLLVFVLPAWAQQREPKIEFYGMTGSYYFAQESNLFKSRRWAPHFAVSALFPIKPKWGFILDGQASKLILNEGLHDPLTGHPASLFYRVHTDIPNEDVTTQWHVSLFPSLVRMWRRDRFSVYFGGGVGSSHDHQTIIHRPIHGDMDFLFGPDDELLLDPEYSDLVQSEDFEIRKDYIHFLAFHLNGGIIVNISKRFVFRSGISVNPTALDSPLAKSIQIGLGYRF